jgi:hypothetical protein
MEHDSFEDDVEKYVLERIAKAEFPVEVPQDIIDRIISEIAKDVDDWIDAQTEEQQEENGRRGVERFLDELGFGDIDLPCPSCLATQYLVEAGLIIKEEVETEERYRVVATRIVSKDKNLNHVARQLTDMGIAAALLRKYDSARQKGGAAKAEPFKERAYKILNEMDPKVVETYKDLAYSDSRRWVRDYEMLCSKKVTA